MKTQSFEQFFDLRGRRVVITGGARGIGLATARMLSEAGASVFVTDRRPRPDELPQGIGFFRGDATAESDVKRAVGKALRFFEQSAASRGIDVLFNCCGVGANLDIESGRKIVMRTFENARWDDLMKVMKVNYWSAVLFTRYCAPHMPKSEKSCIIAASSIWAKGKLYYALPYQASKAALTAFSLSTAMQLKPIRSVCLTLGAFDTPMLNMNPQGPKEASKDTLIGRAGKPEEVAVAVLSVIANPYITNTEVVIDGGSSNR